MTPKPIIAVPKATEKSTIAQLKTSGYVVVVTDSPEKIRIILPQDLVTGGDLLMSAMAGAMRDEYSMRAFSSELYRRMKLNESPHTTPATPTQPDL